MVEVISDAYGPLSCLLEGYARVNAKADVATQTIKQIPQRPVLLAGAFDLKIQSRCGWVGVPANRLQGLDGFVGEMCHCLLLFPPSFPHTGCVSCKNRGR